MLTQEEINEFNKMCQKDPAYRFIARQKDLASEILRYYVNFSVLKEAYPEHLDKKDVLNLWGEDLWNTYHDIRNGFLYKICLNAWILFGDESEHNHDTRYERLVDDRKNTLKQEVVSFLKKLLGSGANNDHEKNLLNRSLLKLADIRSDEFKDSKEFLKRYRNKELAHSEDYSLEKAQNPKEQRFYPELLPLTKLAYGLLAILSNIQLRIESDEYDVGITHYSNHSLQPFDQLITHYQNSFKLGLPKLVALLTV